MYMRLTRLVLGFLVFVGCSKSAQPPSTIPVEPEDQSYIFDSMAAARLAKTESEKWAAYWPIVKKDAVKNKLVQEITGNPIHVSIQFAETPYGWSLVDVSRDKPGEPSTIDIETRFALCGLPWSPVKEPMVQTAMSEKQSMKCEFVEIVYESQSDTPKQFRRVRFRMNP